MFAYKPHFIPSSVILIGAGGTGSRLMPPLAQLIRTCLNKYNPLAWLPSLPLFVIDGDVVEEKNLLRQNFIARDVGSPKSAVVASRYSNAFGIPIYPSVQFVKKGVNLTFQGMPTTIGFSFLNSIVILAVDSADARREILQTIFNNNRIGLCSAAEGSRNIFVIDAGNEDAFGQVKFFTATTLSAAYSDLSVLRNKFPRNMPSTTEVDFIPMDTEYYSQLGSSAAELSCVDLPQTLAINNMMAALICSVVQNFLYLKPMTYDCVRYSLDGAMYTEMNTARAWLTRGDDVPQKSFSSDMRYNAEKRFPGEGKKCVFTAALTSALATYKKAGLRVTPTGDLEATPAPPAPPAPAPELKVEETKAAAEWVDGKKPLRKAKLNVEGFKEVPAEAILAEMRTLANRFGEVPGATDAALVDAAPEAPPPPLERAGVFYEAVPESPPPLQPVR